MILTAICRAYVDLVVSVTEEELTGLGLKIGDDIFLSEDKLQLLILKFIEHGRLLPGGSAANTCAMIAGLGGETAFIGKIANDEPGKSFAEDFRRRGVTFQTIMEYAEGTACCVVLVTPDGERTLLYNPGVSDRISIEDVKSNRELLKNVQYLYLGLTYRVPACGDILNLARGYAKAAKIVTGLQSYQAGETELARHILKTDIVLGNEGEFQNLLIDLGLENMHTLGVLTPKKIFACTQGANGAMILSEGEMVQIAALKIDEIKDTTGAGDAWAGGFLYGLSQNLSIAESAGLGAECAARILRETGGRLAVTK